MQLTKRQAQIVNSAGELLSEQGIQGLTTKKIAERVGFSEGAIYRHFKSKEEIIIAYLRNISDRLEEVFADLDKDSFKASVQLELFIDSQFTFFSGNPQFIIALFSDGLLENNECINDEFKRLLEVNNNHLMPIITSGKQQRIITNSVSTEALLNIINGSIRFQLYRWRTGGFEYDLKLRGKNLTDSIIALISQN